MTSQAPNKQTREFNDPSDLSGPEFLERLHGIGWNVYDFARFIQKHVNTVYGWVNKQGKGHIPMYAELCLTLARTDPVGFLALPRMQTPKQTTLARKKAAAHYAISSNTEEEH